MSTKHPPPSSSAGAGAAAAAADMNLSSSSSSSSSSSEEEVEDHDDDFVRQAEERMQQEMALIRQSMTDAQTTSRTSSNKNSFSDEDDYDDEYDINYDDGDEDDDGDGFAAAAAAAATSTGDAGGTTTMTMSSFPSDYDNALNEDDNEDDEEEMVDWEDAMMQEDDGQKDDSVEDTNTSSSNTNNTNNNTGRQLKAVMIDLKKSSSSKEGRQGEEDDDGDDGDKTANGKQRKKKRRRKIITYRYESLPSDIRFVMDQYYQSHMMCLTSHAVFASQQSSADTLLQHLAYSLIPTPWHTTGTGRAGSSSGRGSVGGASTSSVNHFPGTGQRLDGMQTSTSSPPPPSSNNDSNDSNDMMVVAPTLTDLQLFVEWFNEAVMNRRKASPKSRGRPGTKSFWSSKKSSNSSASSNSHVSSNKKKKEAEAETTASETNDDDGNDDDRWISYRFEEYCRQLSDSMSSLSSPSSSLPTKRNRSQKQGNSGGKKSKNASPSPPTMTSFNDYDHLLFFVACCRSLGWRARYVVAIEPVSRNITEDSPFVWLLQHSSGIASKTRLFGTDSGGGGDGDDTAIDDQPHQHQVGSTTPNSNKASPPVSASPMSAAASSASSLSKSLPSSSSSSTPTTKWSKKMERKLKLATKVCMFLSVASGKRRDEVIVVNANGSDLNDFKIIVMADDEYFNTKPPAKKKLKKTKTTGDTTSAGSGRGGSVQPTNVQTPTGPKLLCWLEVLCDTTETSSKSHNQKKKSRTHVTDETKGRQQRQLKWVHCDPILGMVDRPDLAEVAFHANKTGQAFHRQRRQPIPYVLAVEHVSSPSSTGETMMVNSSDDQSSNCNSIPFKLKDVTSRYATSMIECTRARGPMLTMTADSLWNFARTGGSATMSDWWSQTLQSMNHLNSRRGRTATPILIDRSPSSLSAKSGKTTDDAIEIDEDDDDGDKKPAAVVTPNTPQGYNNAGDTTGAKDPFLDRDLDLNEQLELQQYASTEYLPTSKAAFKKHPLFVIKSILNSTEVLRPDAKKRSVGMFKGELIYRRQDVETALPARKWLYERRKVKKSETDSPILKVKARKKPQPKNFQALKSYGVGEGNDGSEAARTQQIEKASKPLDENEYDLLYGSWQTEPWSPSPVGVNDPIPVNDYKNIELALINPGLKHVRLPKVAAVAKKLQIPYAPCLIGFEHGRNTTPTIRGIVVHTHNEQLLREAHAEVSAHLEKEEEEKKRNAILKRWKRLLVGVLTKDRLEREYGDE